MNRQLKHISLLVNDYDEAKTYYIDKLGFELIEDTKLSATKRWVLIKPKGVGNFSLLLAKAGNTHQEKFVGNQTGGRVFLFMNTDSFDRDYELFKTNGIEFVRQPKTESYGKVAVFKDLYGNLWDLIEPVKLIEEPYFTTAIIELKAGVTAKKAITHLKVLAQKTKAEPGNLIFEIQQLTEAKNKFIIWESFVNKAAFNTHLKSQHLQNVLNTQLFDFVKGYEASKI